MSEQERHPHDEVIRAYLDGKTVQLRHGDRWQDMLPVSTLEVFPAFLRCSEYRVKPETVKYRLALIYYPGMAEAYVSALSVANSEELYERSERFIRWLGDWQEEEI